MLPKSFGVSEVDGIDHGGPDGEWMKWNTKEKKMLAIERASWVFEVEAPKPEAPLEEGKVEATKQLLSAATSIRSLLASLLWLALVAVIIYVAFHWKR